MQDIKAVDRGDIKDVGSVAVKARLIRNRQATAMLEVSLALLKVERFSNEGGSREDISHNLKVLAKYLRDSAF